MRRFVSRSIHIPESSAAYDRCQPFRTGIVMFGVTCLANNYVRIGIKHRIIENRLRFYRTGIDLSNVADSGQFIDPLSVGIVSIITGKLLA